MLFKEDRPKSYWRRRFAFLPKFVGTLNGRNVYVWFGFYEWRFTEDGHQYEYKPRNPPNGFKAYFEDVNPVNSM